MALFGGKEKKENAKKEIMQKLAKHPYLDDLMAEIEMKATSGDEWIVNCQGYYDSRKRTVAVGADAFVLKWFGSHTEQVRGADGKTYTKQVEDIYQNIGYAYTKNGYRPLHGCNVGDVSLGLNDILACWIAVIKERMQAIFPEVIFGGIKYSTNEEASFEYEVPALEWKDWF